MAAQSQKPRAYSYIRMSTEAQLRGDSLRRQVAQWQEYAASQGLELLEEDQLKDIGISAFSGANVSAGVLGQFLRVRPSAIPESARPPANTSNSIPAWRCFTTSPPTRMRENSRTGNAAYAGDLALLRGLNEKLKSSTGETCWVP